VPVTEATDIPFSKLGIPEGMRKNLGPEAPKKVKAAIAAGLVPVPPEVQLGICYVLATDPDSQVAASAQKTLADMPAKTIIGCIGPATHPKVLEFLADRKTDPLLYARLATMKTINDRTALILARRADENLSEMLANNQERLLMTPQVFVELYGNPACPDLLIERMRGFLQLQGELPPVPLQRPVKAEKVRPPDPRRPSLHANAEEDDDLHAALEEELEREILAAQARLESAGNNELQSFLREAAPPGSFEFDFRDEMSEFSWDVLMESDTPLDEQARLTVEQYISSLSIGKKIKLAYKGNADARKILVRDRNKLVATAVIKSGRCTESEVVMYAANRNLDREVIRLIASSSELTRKYPVRLALTNNNKCPPAIALNFMKQLVKRDLLTLTRNRNVSALVTKQAKIHYKQKFQT
jgi:hypothetical protein